MTLSHSVDDSYGRFQVEETPHCIVLRGRKGSYVTESGAWRWVFILSAILAMALPITWSFGPFITICLSAPLGVILLIVAMVAAQANARRGLALLQPTEVKILRGGSSYRSAPSGPELEVDGVSIPFEQIREIAVTRDTSGDDDDFLVDVIAQHHFIELESFSKLSPAQDLARQMGAWLTHQEESPGLDLNGNTRPTFPQFHFGLALLLGAVVIPLGSVAPALLSFDFPAPKGLISVGIVISIVVVLSLASYRHCYKGLRWFLKDQYGVTSRTSR
jgi:hypothetical protein